ncbi:MAG: hypothetical protein R3Y65_04505 [Bacillota bacterium]
MKLTEKAKELAKSMFKEDEDSLLFYAKKVEGGVTLGIGVLKALEEDRVVMVDGMKVVMTEQIEELLADVEFDAENDQFVINDVECDDEDCDCGCGGHHHHHHDSDEDCECGCGGHHHGDGECGCGCGEHEEKGDCDCGCNN